jgi:hypothetical protein
MPSSWGKKHGLPGFDSFRTGLTFEDVRLMLRHSEKHRDKHASPHDRRHTVLGYWHELKLQLYEQAVDLGFAEELDQHLAARDKQIARIWEEVE